MTRRIRAVTFDLDNTLWDVEMVLRDAERVMLTWLGERVPETAGLSPGDFAPVRKQALDELPELRHDVSRLRLEVLTRTIAAAGRNERESRELATGAFDVFLHERHQVKFFDDALDVLDALARRYVLGALTNGNADISRLGLGRYFAFGICAADVGASKPDPAMFRAALARASVRPEQMVHVGDHPIDDIQGASQLAIDTIWVNRPGLPLPEGCTPTRIVASLAEIPARIRELEEG